MNSVLRDMTGAAGVVFGIWLANLFASAVFKVLVARYEAFIPRALADLVAFAG